MERSAPRFRAGRGRRFPRAAAVDCGWGPERPSGRPGNRWLRIDREPLSTGRPGPTRVAPAARAAPFPPGPPASGEGPRSVPRALDLAPSGGAPVRRATPWPSGGRRKTRRIPVGRPGGLGRTYSPATAACQHPCDLRQFGKSAGQCGIVGRAATGRVGIVRRYGRDGCHSFGRSKTVRPPTTVRTQRGRGSPGVRSGRPGVPERGSVDQFATRSSGACTTSSPARQSA